MKTKVQTLEKMSLDELKKKVIHTALIEEFRRLVNFKMQCLDYKSVVITEKNKSFVISGNGITQKKKKNGWGYNKILQKFEIEFTEEEVILLTFLYTQGKASDEARSAAMSNVQM